MPSEVSLRIFPDPILRKVCSPVKDFSSRELKDIIQALEVVLAKQKHGIGIAAPQIGIDKAVAIIDVRNRIPKAQRQILINPQMIESWDEIASREGCMSLPDYRGDIKRYRQVLLEWDDQEGHHFQKRFEGIEAICIQHEVDHLKGLLFIDRVTSLKRDMIPRPKG